MHATALPTVARRAKVAHRNGRLLWLAALVLASSSRLGAQTAEVMPAFVARGRQTEARQRAYHDRIEGFYQVLSRKLQIAAPDLVAMLASPSPAVHGYAILPKVVANTAPPPPGTTSQVVSYSWGWSDTLIEREMETLGQLEAELRKVPPTAAGRTSYEKLATGYRTLIANRGPIDADIQYNWLWQEQIARDRPLFDRLNKVQNDVLERLAIEAAIASQDEGALRAAARDRGLDSTASPDSITVALAARAQSVAQEIAAGTPPVAPPDFARIDHSAGGRSLVTVPLYTDIVDAAFIEAFRHAVETVWRARDASGEQRVSLAIEIIPPERLYCGTAAVATTPQERCAPPAEGAAIDLDTHVARFPVRGAILTTGAPTLHVLAGRAIVLGPHDVTPNTLAHEFGHVLGFPDTYRRGYRDLGADGYQITELEDRGDLMGAPGTGPVLGRHFQGLIAAMDVQTMQAGLDALYQGNDPEMAVARFREVLARTPTHYGATFQLAKALEQAGRTDEAVTLWKKMLAMAEAIGDADTIGVARARIEAGSTRMPK